MVAQVERDNTDLFDEIVRWIKQIVASGTSLGGARPKATVASTGGTSQPDSILTSGRFRVHACGAVDALGAGAVCVQHPGYIGTFNADHGSRTLGIRLTRSLWPVTFLPRWLLLCVQSQPAIVIRDHRRPERDGKKGHEH